MPPIDDAMPEQSLQQVLTHLADSGLPAENSDTHLTGWKWIHQRLSVSDVDCEGHFHAECPNCGSVKCLGADKKDHHGYEPWGETTQRCDCSPNGITHRIVPFDIFGRHIGFPAHTGHGDVRF